MRLLLDTHALLWILTDERRIPPRIRRMLIDGGNDVLASAVNIFELAARTAAARRIGANVTAERVRQLTIAAGFPLLAVSDAHAAAVEGLATFHGDPFDRLLLAQAQVEGLQLVTHDERLAQYDSRTILF